MQTKEHTQAGQGQEKRKTLHRRTDYSHPGGIEIWQGSGRDLSGVRGSAEYPVSMEKSVRRDEARGTQAFARVGGRESPLEANSGPAGVRHRWVEGFADKKVVRVADKRCAVSYLQTEHTLSERHACPLVGMTRSTQRDRSQQANDEVELVAALRDYAGEYPHYGYRLITALLQQAGYAVNHKRIERIWRQEGLQQPQRTVYKRRFGEGGDVKQRAQYLNHVWSYDFTEDRTENNQRVRVLAVLDEFTRQCLMLHASTSIPSAKVVDILEWLVMLQGTPAHIRSDNGPEFVANKVKLWITGRGSQTLYIEPGHPWENPFIERFIGTLKNDCLNRCLFDTLAEAQAILDHWLVEYNAYRPHSALGYLTPDAFAALRHSEVLLTSTGT
jgi:putative transposase